MPPKPKKHKNSNEELTTQMKAMQISIDVITKQHDTFHKFIYTQLPNIIKDHLFSSFSSNHST